MQGRRISGQDAFIIIAERTFLPHRGVFVTKLAVDQASLTCFSLARNLRRRIGAVSEIVSAPPSESKQPSAAVRQAALQHAVFSSKVFSSIATDARGVIQLFNGGAEHMLGYLAVEVVDKVTPADLSDPDELLHRAHVLSAECGISIAPGFEALVFKAQRGIEDIYELTYLRKDGRRLPAVVSVTALRDPKNAIIGYLLIGTDNTARRQAEDERGKLDQRLRDQHFYVRSLIESNIDALMATDPRGIITDVNKQAESLTGCTRDELIGAPFRSCFTEPAMAAAGIARVLAEGKVTNYELTARARNGTLTVVSYNATTFYDREGVLQGVFASARDVTTMKRFERALQRTNTELEAASRMKSEFLANMSHELRTPLNAIIGFSELLKDGLIGELSDQQRGFVGDIYGAGRHLLSLINDILDLSRVEAGQVVLEVEAVDVASLLTRCLTGIRQQASVRRIRVVTDTASAPAVAQVDPDKVAQIVCSLLSNAVKFTPEGGEVALRVRGVPRAEINWERATQPGAVGFTVAAAASAEFLEVTVTDNGIGISEAGMGKLFQPFGQLDAGPGRFFEGPGLGLARVKLLAELHGGTVGVVSALGQGSTFTVWLPLRSLSPGGTT